MGKDCPPFYGKTSKFYKNKIAKSEAKIAELKEIIKVCKEELAKIDE